jgi:hypothetical protein
MSTGVQERLQLAILRNLKQGLPVEPEALATPAAGSRDVARAIRVLMMERQVEFSGAALSLTTAGRRRLADSR